MNLLRDLFYLGLALSFAIGAVVEFWWPQRHPPLQSLMRHARAMLFVGGTVMVMGVALDTLILTIINSHIAVVPRFGFAQAMVLSVGLSMMLSALLIHENKVIGFFTPFWCALSAVVLAVAYFYPATHIIHLNSLESEIHFALAMLSHAMFSLFSLFAVMSLIQTQRLKNPHDFEQLRAFPPLIALDRQFLWMGRLTWVLLTVALITGFIYSDKSSGVAFYINHKFIFSILAWCVISIVVWGQYRHGWRGRGVALLTLMGYALMLLGYIGSRFVLDVILHRG